MEYLTFLANFELFAFFTTITTINWVLCTWTATLKHNWHIVRPLCYLSHTITNLANRGINIQLNLHRTLEKWAVFTLCSEYSPLYFSRQCRIPSVTEHCWSAGILVIIKMMIIQSRRKVFNVTVPCWFRLNGMQVCTA